MLSDLTLSFYGSLVSLYNLALIIFPLLIFIEILKEIGVVSLLGKVFTPLTKFLKLPQQSVIPVTVGLLIGLTYGAGVMISVGREENFSTKDLTKILVFVGISHALVEETVIFAGIGANAFIVLTARVLSALMATIIYSRFTRSETDALHDSGRITQ